MSPPLLCTSLLFHFCLLRTPPPSCKIWERRMRGEREIWQMRVSSRFFSLPESLLPVGCIPAVQLLVVYSLACILGERLLAVSVPCPPSSTLPSAALRLKPCCWSSAQSPLLRGRGGVTMSVGACFLFPFFNSCQVTLPEEQRPR